MEPVVDPALTQFNLTPFLLSVSLLFYFYLFIYLPWPESVLHITCFLLITNLFPHSITNPSRLAYT
jgi:hypothetical protein